jgi:hypothetical protein
MYSLLDGDPGLGKSTLTVDLAARISTGRTMPDGSGGGEPRGVILLSAEDDRSRTILPRLRAAGADLTRVLTFDMAESDGSSRPPMITPGDLEGLEDLICANDVALAVLDPLTAYLPDGLDTNRDANVRRVLSRVTKLAGDTGCAILGLRHFRKSPSENALYRGGGSVAFIAASRAAHMMAVDPDEPSGNRRILAPLKMNIGPMPPSLALRLVVDGPGGYPRIAWEGPSHRTAASLSALPFKGPRADALDRACEVVAVLLAGGPLPAAEVYRRAAEQGVSERTVDRAKAALGIESVKLGQPGERGHWVWFLPKDANIGRRMPTTELGTLGVDLAPFGREAVEADFPASAWDVDVVPA